MSRRFSVKQVSVFDGSWWVAKIVNSRKEGRELSAALNAMEDKITSTNKRKQTLKRSAMR
jgi:hypothetical protein